MEINLKQKKGITLIALVITIVVLLILAGVTIAMLTGDNGILTKATTAKTKSAEEEAREKVNLMLASWKMENALNSNVDFDNYKDSEDIKSFGIDKITKDDTQEGLYIAHVKIGDKTYYVEILIENNNVQTRNVLDSLDIIKVKITKPNYTFEDTTQITIEATASSEEATITEIKLTKTDDTNEITGTIEGNTATFTIEANKEYKYTITDSKGKNASGTILIEKLEEPNIEILNVTDKSFKINVKNKYPNDVILEYYVKEKQSTEWKKSESIEIEGLKNGTEYEVKVKAVANGISKETIKNDVKTLILTVSMDDDGIPYNVSKAGLLGTAGGRSYCKKYDGNAIAFSCYYYGARFYLISTNENAAQGYCEQFGNGDSQLQQFDYINKTWYWLEIPFGFADSITGVETSYCPNLGSVSVIGDTLVRKILREAYGLEELEKLIPIMTADNAPSGQITYSSSYLSRPACKAFNRTQADISNGNGYWVSQDDYSECWLAYEFAKPVSIKEIEYKYSNSKAKTEISVYVKQNNTWNLVKKFDSAQRSDGNFGYDSIVLNEAITAEAIKICSSSSQLALSEVQCYGRIEE